MLSGSKELLRAMGELAIAHQIRLEIRREKGVKTTVCTSSSSQHFAVLNVDEMLNENVE